MKTKELQVMQRLLQITLHVSSLYLQPPYTNAHIFDFQFRELLYGSFDYTNYFILLIQKLKPNTIYCLTDSFNTNYAIFPIPEAEGEILLIGPYLQEEATEEFLYAIMKKHKLSSTSLYSLKQYFNRVSLVDGKTIFASFNQIASYLYGGESSYSMEFRSEYWRDLDTDTEAIEDLDMLLQMNVMEERYKLENELLNAVSKGDRHTAVQLFQEMGAIHFSQRSSDPIRNSKNYAIVLNTMFRKAAQASFIHPIYLDDLSHKMGLQIEQAKTLQEIENLMLTMVRRYCTLVRNHSLQSYSPIIRKSIDYINLNLGSPLSLKILAEHFNINSSYLSSLFKKETGLTLTDYINTQRINTAIRLLNSTDMNIQAISYYVGIDDVNYFCRLFKKKIGITATEYKSSITKGSL